MASTSEAQKINPAVDLGIKILAVLVIPLGVFGYTMGMDVSILKERVIQIQSQQSDHRIQNDAASSRINQIALAVQDTNSQIRELRTMLDSIRDPYPPRHSGVR